MAPKDSFLVANAAYLASQTGSDAAEAVLLRSSGDVNTLGVAASAAGARALGMKVAALGETQGVISSSLSSGSAAVDPAQARLLANTDRGHRRHRARAESPDTRTD